MVSSYDTLESTFIHHIQDEIGFLQLGLITAENIQGLINLKSRFKSYSTVKKIFEFIQSVFKHACSTNLLEYNPCDAVELPIQHNMNIKTKEIEILSGREVTELYDFNNLQKESFNRFF